jgi:hypothetical protein
MKKHSDTFITIAIISTIIVVISFVYYIVTQNDTALTVTACLTLLWVIFIFIPYNTGSN